MILKVNPTRINLLNLKKDLKTAQKGYKLLKDKRDGLMKKFMEVIQETKALREKTEKEISGALNSYLRASGSMSEKAMNSAFILPSAKI